MKQYEPFCKVFLDDKRIQKIHNYYNNTNASASSSTSPHFVTSQRKEHHISCSADSIGPILTFEQYAGCGRPNSTSTTTTTIEEDEPLFD